MKYLGAVAGLARCSDNACRGRRDQDHLHGWRAGRHERSRSGVRAQVGPQGADRFRDAGKHARPARPGRGRRCGGRDRRGASRSRKGRPDCAGHAHGVCRELCRRRDPRRRAQARREQRRGRQAGRARGEDDGALGPQGRHAARRDVSRRHRSPRLRGRRPLAHQVHPRPRVGRRRSGGKGRGRPRRDADQRNPARRRRRACRRAAARPSCRRPSCMPFWFRARRTPRRRRPSSIFSARPTRDE